MSQRPGVSAFSLTVLCISSLFGQTEDYSMWLHASNDTINTTSDGSNIGSDLVKFPYPVRLAAENFNFSQARGNGADIRFANSAGTPLPFEIELWDSTGKAALIWVLIDTVKKLNDNQHIRMYWGKTGVTARSNPQAVFDTANNFSYVWHFSPLDTFADATARRNKGTNTGTTPVKGAILGHARYFNGQTAEIGLDSNCITVLGGLQATMSFWIRTSSTNNGGTQWNNNCLIGDDRVGGSGDIWWGVLDAGKVGILTSGGPLGDDASMSFGDVTQNTWQFVTITRNAVSGAIQIFLNGVLDKDFVSSTVVSRSTDASLRILGRNVDGGNRGGHVIGEFDEIRIENSVRSADWIKFSYLTQKNLPFFKPGIKYQRDTFYVKNDSMLHFLPVITGQADTFYSTPEVLPEYVSINAVTGEFFGWFGNLTSPISVYVTARNGRGSGKDTVTFAPLYPVRTVGKNSRMQGFSSFIIGTNRSSYFRVHYCCPLTDAVNCLRFSLYDLKGTVLMSKNVAGAEIVSGAQWVSLGPNGLLPGTYCLTMEAVKKDKKHEVVQQKLVTVCGE